jgi:hypothetical protein
LAAARANVRVNLGAGDEEHLLELQIGRVDFFSAAVLPSFTVSASITMMSPALAFAESAWRSASARNFFVRSCE